MTGQAELRGDAPAGVDQNAVSRAIANVGLTVVRTLRDKEETREQMSFRETELQFQFPIAGNAGTTPVWQTASFDFDHAFMYAPGQRDSDLDRPHFTYGAVIDGGNPVIVSACVTGWKMDAEREAITGATVAICTYLPDADDLVGFGGYVHFTFQGYAGVNEDETDV